MKTTIMLSIEEILLDANVMIDLKGTHNTDIASLLSQSLRVAIVEQTRRKVSGLTPSLCKKLGIEIIFPETDEIILASDIREKTHQLAEDDALTLAIAHEQKMMVISNDGRVVETAKSMGVEARREFFLLLYLYQRGQVTKDRCLKIVADVTTSNPWIGDDVARKFQEALESE